MANEQVKASDPIQTLRDEVREVHTEAFREQVHDVGDRVFNQTVERCKDGEPVEPNIVAANAEKQMLYDRLKRTAAVAEAALEAAEAGERVQRLHGVQLYDLSPCKCQAHEDFRAALARLQALAEEEEGDEPAVGHSACAGCCMVVDVAADMVENELWSRTWKRDELRRALVTTCTCGVRK